MLNGGTKCLDKPGALGGGGREVRSMDLPLPASRVLLLLALVPPMVCDHLVIFHGRAAMKRFTLAHD